MWLGPILHLIRAAAAGAVISYQFFDVHSTILALRRHDVVEVGDEALGLGNISGWCQARLGIFWPVMKLPVIALMAPLLWVQVPIAIEPGIIFALVYLVAYFRKIVRQNYNNAFGVR